MYFWVDQGKSRGELIRRKTILKKMENIDRGWLFVEYVSYPNGGNCDVTNQPIKTGVKVYHPQASRTFTVSMAIAIKYVDDVVIPRQTPENTLVSL